MEKTLKETTFFYDSYGRYSKCEVYEDESGNQESVISVVEAEDQA